MSVLTVGAALATYCKTLQDTQISTARLDCLILLEDILQKDRASLLAHPEIKIEAKDAQRLKTLIERRATHEPLAYIRGQASFYNRPFRVTPAVLTPRPETETMIDLLKQQQLPQSPRIADVGSGSGCIGITAALELPAAHVDLYDISPKAIIIAADNAARLGAHVRTHISDLLTNLVGDYDILLANLPYVPVGFPTNRAAQFEPSIALFAGTDGLKDYEVFWRQVQKLSHKPQLILTESFPSQHHALATMARNAGYTMQHRQDFIQVFAHL